MHECPECGGACDCDGDDVWVDYAAQCKHGCTLDDMELEDYYRDAEEKEVVAWENWAHAVEAHEALMKKYRLRNWWRAMKYRFAFYVFQRCSECGKPKRIFGREVGQHKECDHLPF